MCHNPVAKDESQRQTRQFSGIRSVSMRLTMPVFWLSLNIKSNFYIMHKPGVLVHELSCYHDHQGEDGSISQSALLIQNFSAFLVWSVTRNLRLVSLAQILVLESPQEARMEATH